MNTHRKIEGVRLVVTLALLALGACTTPQYETVNQEVLADIQTTLETASGTDTSAMNTQPPEDVLQALVPGLTLNSAELQPVEERFDFAVQEPMEAREFFSLLTAGTDYSVAVHPGVNGAISALDLKNVTIQEALDQVSDLYGYSINRRGNIFQVTPSGLQTRIFKVDYLNVNRTGNSNMSVVTSGLLSGGAGGGGGGNSGVGGVNGAASGGSLGGGGDFATGGAAGGTGGAGGSGGGAGGGNAGGANITTTSESDYWADLEEIILSIIGSSAPSQSTGAGIGLLDSLATVASSSDTERAVTVIPQTGMIVVRAYPDELDQVAEFLAQSQAALQRQVVLEAKILEVTLNEKFQAGIDLSLLERLNTDNDLGLRSSFVNDAQTNSETGNATYPIGGIAQAFQLAYDASDFDAVIRLLETQGNVQVISSPRITTLNNQKAVFKVGDEEYFSTNPTSSTTTGGNSTTSNQNANLQPFFSGIALDVTPQISASGDIILHIHPLLNTVEQDLKVIGGDVVPLAKSDTRESDSVARARNGEVVIISGLMQTRARGTEAGIPGARDIPVVGNAFERTQRDTEKTELVILLRAIVDDNGNMQQLIQDHTDSFDAMRQQLDPYYR
jgi:MSHA biogenesis protein MshL